MGEGWRTGDGERLHICVYECFCKKEAMFGGGGGVAGGKGVAEGREAVWREGGG